MTLRRGLHNRCLSVLHGVHEFSITQKDKLQMKMTSWQNWKENSKKKTFFEKKTIQIMYFQVFRPHWMSTWLFLQTSGSWVDDIQNQPPGRKAQGRSLGKSHPMTDQSTYPGLGGGMDQKEARVWSWGLIFQKTNGQIQPIMRPFRGVVRFGRGFPWLVSTSTRNQDSPRSIVQGWMFLVSWQQ